MRLVDLSPTAAPVTVTWHEHTVTRQSVLDLAGNVVEPFGEVATLQPWQVVTITSEP